ncbi:MULTISPECIES: integrase core domain-containing protein [Nitrosomonas]
MKEVRQNLFIWFEWYNQERFHQSLDSFTPDKVYYNSQRINQVA